MAFIYQVRGSGPCLVAEKTSAVPTICTKFRSSAVPTIWAKCFAVTTQKFNKGRTKPNLSPNGDRSGYKFRSVQGRGQAFFGETSWNGTSGPVEILEGRISVGFICGRIRCRRGSQRLDYPLGNRLRQRYSLRQQIAAGT